MRTRFFFRPICVLVLLALGAGAARAELRGHGGPVRAIAVLPGGERAVSGGFDHAAILWDLGAETASQVLGFHDGAVNAVLALADGRFATAGEDGRIALWHPGGNAPERSWTPHTGPIVGLAVSRDGARLLSASWDGTAVLTDTARGSATTLSGHTGPVNAVAFTHDGRAVSAGYDGTLRFWPEEGGAPAVVTLTGPINTIATIGDDVAVGGADGVLRLLRPDGVMRWTLDLQAGPILAMSASPDRGALAVGTIGGALVGVEAASGRIWSRIAGRGGPIWSIAFLPNEREVLAGSADRLIRRWDIRTGEQIGSVAPRTAAALPSGAEERGAEVFRACSACHALTAGEGLRAGPTLHGVFGRRIGTAPGYAYSEALRRLDIVWNAETISRLFEVGPTAYTPGTKMPEQIVTPRDREALVRYLERATR